MDKPWLQQPHWPRTVRSNARLRTRLAWGCAVFWLLVTSPVLLVVPEEVVRGNWAALAALLFPLVGIGMLGYAIRLTREWGRYGVTELTLDPYPGSIGGHVGGTISLKLPLREAAEVSLECVRSYVWGSGKHGSRCEDVLWQASGLAACSAKGLEFRFDVPSGLPPSEEKAGDQYRYWRVHLRNDAADIALDRTFDVGVFATAESSRNIRVDTTALGHARARQTITDALDDPSQSEGLPEGFPEGLPEQLRLSIERSANGLRMVLHAGRQKRMALGMFAVGVAFAAVGWFVPADDLGATLIKWVFGAFGWGLILGAAYLPFNRLEVRVAPDEVRQVREWFGMVIARQRVRPEQIAELEITQGSSTRTGNRSVIYYRLVGRGSFGEFRFLESIPDKMLVEALRDQVMRHAGLAPSGG